jgi:hypothetical protein
MKALRHSLIALTLMFALPAPAAILPGQITGYGMLGCMMTNYTGAPQIVDQVQYQYTCNHGPRDPFHQYYQVMPCFGLCEVDSGRTFWHNNGPWTYNCMVISGTCHGYSHTAPTPRPSPSVSPSPFEF